MWAFFYAFDIAALFQENSHSEKVRCEVQNVVPRVNCGAAKNEDGHKINFTHIGFSGMCSDNNLHKWIW